MNLSPSDFFIGDAWVILALSVGDPVSNVTPPLYIVGVSEKEI
jgi:hypothetical protein